MLCCFVLYCSSSQLEIWFGVHYGYLAHTMRFMNWEHSSECFRVLVDSDFVFYIAQTNVRLLSKDIGKGDCWFMAHATGDLCCIAAQANSKLDSRVFTLKKMDIVDIWLMRSTPSFMKWENPSLKNKLDEFKWKMWKRKQERQGEFDTKNTKGIRMKGVKWQQAS